MFTVIFGLLFLSNIINVIANNCISLHTSITQHIEKPGFHKDLEYLVEMVAEGIYIYDKGCEISIHQVLPPSLYVNEDQLADLHRLKKLVAFPAENVDVETAEHHSTKINLYIYKYLNRPKIVINVPIHLRYHRSTLSGGYERVEISKPHILIHCPNTNITFCSNISKAPCASYSEDMCEWENITYQLISQPLELRVPVGCLEHYPLVAIATFLVTCAGCFYILSSLAVAGLYKAQDKQKSKLN